MQTFCTHTDSCLHFFPGMGFRPAVHVLQRDQYGDHPVLIVGDDSPVEGKVPPGWMMTDLPIDPYAVAEGSPHMAWLTPASAAATTLPALAMLGGGSGWGGGSSGTKGTGGSGDTVPGDTDPVVPPIWGGSSDPAHQGGGTTQPPGGPDLPPLQPVPIPGPGILLLSVLVILTLGRTVGRVVRG